MKTPPSSAPATPPPAPASGTEAAAANARNVAADQLKGLLIFLVTWGHCIQFFCTGSAYSNPAFRFIYCFHMPLFMGISGYFSFMALKRQDWSGGISRRFRQIALPVIAWSTIWSLAILLICVVVIPDANWRWIVRVPADILSHSVYSFWFLVAVLGATLIVLTLRAFKADHAGGLIVCSLLFMAAPEYPNFALYKYVLPFFCTGYWIARTGFTMTASARNIAAWSVLAAASLFFWTDLTYVYASGSALSRDNSVNLAIRYITGFAMSVAVVLLSKKILSPAPLRILTRWGQRSLEIYMIQIVFFGIIESRLKLLPPSWGFLVLFPAAWLLNEAFAFIGLLLERHQITSAFFLGREKLPAKRPVTSAS